MAAVLGQFFALSHEIAVRHVRCAEHGELTHVAALSGAPALDATSGPALRAEEADAASAHDHCATTFTLHAGATSPVLRSPVQAPPPAAAAFPCTSAPVRDRALVLASAPKTSPPSVL